MKQILVFLFALISCIKLLSAQSIDRQLVNTGGFSCNTGSIFFDFSIGEPVVTTIVNQNIVLTQGFLQPDELIVNTYKKPNCSYFFYCYPNPANDRINIDFEVEGHSEYLFILYDAFQRPIINKTLGNLSKGRYTEAILLDGILPGIYLLSLVKNNLVLQSIKIIKMN